MTEVRLAEEQDFSGAVRVDLDGDITLHAAFGLAHRGRRLAHTVEARFGIASGSKAFISHACPYQASSQPRWCGASRIGDKDGMSLRRAGLVGMAFTFARSQQGQRLISQARQRYDTPANRAKVRQAVSGLRPRMSP